MDLLLSKSGATPRSQTYDIIESDLKLRVRELKRRLFESRDDPIGVLLSNDDTVMVTASELE